MTTNPMSTPMTEDFYFLQYVHTRELPWGVYWSLDDHAVSHHRTRDEAVAALATITPKKDIGEWQPIETAPKDGTHILGLYEAPNKDFQAVCVMRWRPHWKDWASFPGDYGKQPTHWMLAPATPTPQPQEG